MILLALGFTACGDDEPDVADDPVVEESGAGQEEVLEFQSLDVNNDSYLDIEEIPDAEQRDAFSGWDTDRNAVIEADEVYGTAFMFWDIDKNGRISEAEWRENAEVWYARPVGEAFSDWDGDGDSELDADEFAERFDFSAVGESWRDALNEQTFKNAYFELYDADNDGRVSELEWQRGKAVWGTPPDTGDDSN